MLDNKEFNKLNKIILYNNFIYYAYKYEIISHSI